MPQLLISRIRYIDMICRSGGGNRGLPSNCSEGTIQYSGSHNPCTRAKKRALVLLQGGCLPVSCRHSLLALSIDKMHKEQGQRGQATLNA